MALSLPSLDIINPQYHQSFPLEGNPETFDLFYDTLPPTIFSFEADDNQNFASSMFGLDQIDQILVPCYNSTQKKEEESNAPINTFDPNYFNNSIISGIGDNIFGEIAPVFSDPITNHTCYVQESPKQEKISQKRHIKGEEVQISKKQCGTNRKQDQARVTSPSKDTQSLAAKNRRERISERLKVLQELVPNGTKVDLVTMLEKAISYVKFLQLQVQVLETDEFWSGQGRKAPDISQVEEAIDAILSSCHRNDKSNCDKNKTNIEL